MELTTYEQHDDYAAGRRGELPAVGCGICGRQVEPVLEVEHWDQLAAAEQVEVLELLAAWSREHAASHSQPEHDDFGRRLQAPEPPSIAGGVG